MTPDVFINASHNNGISMVLVALVVIIGVPTVWFFLTRLWGSSQTRIDNKDTLIVQMAKEGTSHIATNTETMRMLADGQTKIAESIVRMEQTMASLVTFQKERADRVDASFDRVIEDIRENKRANRSKKVPA